MNDNDDDEWGLKANSPAGVLYGWWVSLWPPPPSRISSPMTRGSPHPITSYHHESHSRNPQLLSTLFNVSPPTFLFILLLIPIPTNHTLSLKMIDECLLFWPYSPHSITRVKTPWWWVLAYLCPIRSSISSHFNFNPKKQKQKEDKIFPFHVTCCNATSIRC